MFQHILVCTDGSEHALLAARAAAEIARRFKPEVTLLSVLDPISTVVPYIGQWEMIACAGEFVDCATNAQEQSLLRTGEILSEAGVSFNVIRGTGRPVDVIEEYATRLQCDLVVLGSRGQTSWGALLLGSVADGVARYVNCPVLIVRGNKASIEHILLASDGSAAAFRAARCAGAIANGFETGVSVLTVTGHEHAHLPTHSSDKQSEPSVDCIEKATVDELKLHYGTCEFLHAVGHPAQFIVDYAQNHDTDLIVLGSRGLGAFKSMLMGSVSNRVMHYAEQSVLIVH